MKHIIAIMLLACTIGISSCELESNASYTGNYYSYHKKEHKQTKDVQNTAANYECKASSKSSQKSF